MNKWTLATTSGNDFGSVMKSFLPAALLALLLAPFAARAEERLTILHTSEHHGALLPIESGPFTGLGGVARRAALIERIRKEAKNVLVVDSGDLVIGTAMSSVFRGAPDIAAMNLMGYDALALGNHDFDFGLGHLSDLKKSARFPFLCSNLRPIKPGVCQPFAIKTVGRLRIGLLGLVGRRSFPDLFSRSAVREVAFEDPIAAAAATARELRRRVDLVVAVTHEDTEEDLALAKAVGDIDVIVGGHTAGFDGLMLSGSEAPVQGRVDPVPRGPIFVKGHQQARALGRLDLVYDKGVRAAEAQNISIDASVPEQPKVAALAQDYARRLDAAGNRVLGQALVDLQGESPAVRTRETNFGNLLADLARGRAGTEIALLNAGAIRSGIGKGPVTLKRVIQALPYDHPLIACKLTGAELRAAIENAVSELPKEAGRFLQVSGLSFSFDASAAVGSRIKEVWIKGAPLQNDWDYSIVVTQFIAEGGDGYTVFSRAREKVEHQAPLSELLAAALKQGPVTAKEEGRIKIVGSKQ
jgi:5'-nucleotidase/UDP-sugar diphosphatase